MVKYKSKPIIIDAEMFTVGKEDGFYFYPIKSNQYIYAMTNEELEKHPCPFENTYGVPFIETFNGRQKIYLGDYIVTSEDGKRDVYKAEEFKKLYSPVVDMSEYEEW